MPDFTNTNGYYPMTVKVIRAFHNKITGLDQFVGDTLNCSTERGYELIKLNFVVQFNLEKDIKPKK